MWLASWRHVPVPRSCQDAASFPHDPPLTTKGVQQVEDLWEEMKDFHFDARDIASGSRHRHATSRRRPFDRLVGHGGLGHGRPKPKLTEAGWFVLLQAVSFCSCAWEPIGGPDISLSAKSSPCGSSGPGGLVAVLALLANGHGAGGEVQHGHPCGPCASAVRSTSPSHVGCRVHSLGSTVVQSTQRIGDPLAIG